MTNHLAPEAALAPTLCITGSFISPELSDDVDELEDEAFEARAFASSEISTLSTGILPTFAVLSSFVAEAATLELLLVVPWSTKTWDEYDVLIVVHRTISFCFHMPPKLYRIEEKNMKVFKKKRGVTCKKLTCNV